LANKYEDNLQLIVKYYPYSKQGISKQLFNFGENDEYFIKGSVGKGLDLGPTSSGNHVFFCGGTGVLPFLDTFAYVLRKKLAQFDKAHMMFEDEQF